MTEHKFKPFVPANTDMKEFTIRSLIIGLIMAVVLGAANAYLGLKAGMTIAATYPAAVIGMAILRMMKGTILEENFARTVGSIGESVAAGAIFTIPAFYIAGIWTDFATLPNYLIASSIMLVGGVLGVLFVALLRRVMVEDVELPFPESVAAAEIHKAGQKGGTGAKFLFGAMGLGAGIQALISLKVFTDLKDWFITFKKAIIQLGSSGSATGQSGMVLTAPRVSPAYIGVGYIIGPKLASLNFSGGLLAWGLFVPILTYFIAPSILPDTTAVTTDTWMALSSQVWRNLVRPIAVGGMLMSAIYTLFKMRKSLINGLSRSISDVKKAAQGVQVNERTEQDLKFTTVMFGISLAAVGTFFIYLFFAKNVIAALVATVVMIIAGFFFAAVSGYLVGIIGSSNNPISGLTLSTLIVAALLMVALGMKGTPGVAAVLGVAGVVCVSAAVAGEMLQDLKVGHILGGTPWKMQVGDLIGVALSAVVMFIPLIILHQGDINMGGTGLGGTNLAAPQASLMAMLSQGIVSGEMAWPLIIVGILLGLGFILMQVKSPMLVCVGMYLGLETTFAIFVGGLIRGLLDHYVAKRRCNDAQKSRVENTGVLLAAGLIAGEALVGLLVALLAILKVGYDKWLPSIFNFLPFRFEVSLLIFGLIGWILVSIPLKNAGKADEPAPPSAVM
ncbi:MAG TPA: oligopeptide transporter, OPT family [Candidatus Marinimicrobia bacterium]|nr:oligopeptide transporter, OPT family [Candidatus Neomarinimicrobiota bacterium]HRD17876.1 oligopeptide transporter, OPT family [Candidatus Neomarinimicrobiota bacterium]